MQAALADRCVRVPGDALKAKGERRGKRNSFVAPGCTDSGHSAAGHVLAPLSVESQMDVMQQPDTAGVAIADAVPE